MGYQVAVLTQSGSPQCTASTRVLCDALKRGGHTALPFCADGNLTTALSAARPDAACLVTDDPQLDEALRDLLDLLRIPHIGSAADICRTVRDRRTLGSLINDAFAYGESTACVPPFVTLSSPCFDDLGAADALDRIAERIGCGYPLCVRRASGGAARQACDDAQLTDALHTILSASGIPGENDAVVLQEWVDGVHLFVGVLGDADDLQVLPPVELTEEKGAPAFHTPVRMSSLADDPDVAEDARSEIERGAVDTYLISGCRDLALVEVVWDGARTCILNVDPAPAWDASSPLARALAAAQIELSDVLDALVERAVERG